MTYAHQSERSDDAAVDAPARDGALPAGPVPEAAPPDRPARQAAEPQDPDPDPMPEPPAVSVQQPALPPGPVPDAELEPPTVAVQAVVAPPGPVPDTAPPTVAIKGLARPAGPVPGVPPPARPVPDPGPPAGFGPDEGAALPDAGPASPRSLKAMVFSVWSQHGDLLRNAASLLATTGVTSVLGAAYWTIAARFYTQSSVGYAAAEIPVMTLLGMIGMLGLGTLMVGELPRAQRRAELLSAALITCAVGSALLGVAFAYLAPGFNQRFADLLGTPGDKVLLIIGVTLTAVSFVFDMATIGLMRGGIQLARNIAFSVIKLVALPVFAYTLHDGLGIGIVVSWTGGIALSLVLVALRLLVAGGRSIAAPDWVTLRGMARTAMAHNWLEIAVSVPPAAFPVLTTLLVSPSANAAFYVAFTLASVVYMVPAHLSTVLFAVAAAEPESIPVRVRFTMKLSYAIGLPVVAVLALGSHWILLIYGPGYAATAAVPMALVALGYLPSVPKALYIAICRAHDRTTYIAVLLTIFTVLEIGGAVAGGILDGLVGLALGIFTSLMVQGLAVTPSIIRVILPTLRRRADGLPVVDAAGRTPRFAPGIADTVVDLLAITAAMNGLPEREPTVPVPVLDAKRARSFGLTDVAERGSVKERQDAGIQALIALAQSVNTTGGFSRLQ